MKPQTEKVLLWNFRNEVEEILLVSVNEFKIILHFVATTLYFRIITHFVIHYTFIPFSIIYAVVQYFLIFKRSAFEEKCNDYASPLPKWKTACCVPDLEESCCHLMRSANSLKCWTPKWLKNNPIIWWKTSILSAFH